MFKKTKETDDNLNKLLRKLDETALRLDITKNEFLSLHNRQFVESRVYEDDESVEAKHEDEKEKVVFVLMQKKFVLACICLLRLQRSQKLKRKSLVK